MPVANRTFRDIQIYFAAIEYASVLLEENVLDTPIDGLTVFVRERENSGNMHGILIQDNRDPLHVITMLAEEGETPADPPPAHDFY